MSFPLRVVHSPLPYSEATSRKLDVLGEQQQFSWILYETAFSGVDDQLKRRKLNTKRRIYWNSPVRRMPLGHCGYRCFRPADGYLPIRRPFGPVPDETACVCVRTICAVSRCDSASAGN